jgi:hypothetical protein
MPFTVGLLAAFVGFWMATAWPYRLNVGNDGLGLTFTWGHREIPWSAVDGFRYFYGREGYVPGVSAVYVRLR